MELKIMQVVEVNLIITDYSMPGMTGYDLLRKVKVSIDYNCISFSLVNYISISLMYIYIFIKKVIFLFK